MNTVYLTGNLGKDAELRTFEDGNAVCNASLGVRRWNGKDKETTTDWFRLTAWGKVGQALAEVGTKGTKLLIVGNMKEEKWKDSSGAEKKGYCVIVEKFEKLESRSATASGGSASGTPF